MRDWESGVFGVPEDILCVCFLVNSLLRFWWVWLLVVHSARPSRRANPGACLEHQSRHDFDMYNWFPHSGTSQAPWRPRASPRPLQELGWLGCVGVLS